jgi:Mrp family chromosome partitioning ATPase/capsular polysaccharide biosynthesis protein
VSTRDDFVDRPATLAQYQAILRRRKWIIIGVPVIAAVVAYALSAGQSALYQAKARVYIRTTNVVSSFGGVNPYLGDPTRLLNNEAKLATSPVIAPRVVKRAGVPGITPGAFLGAASASPETDADLLDLSVSYRDPRSATKLVNAYADEFASYTNELYTASLQAALLKVQATIARLQAQHQTGTSAYDEALSTRDALRTFGSSVANSATVQSLANGASQIRPRPKRNALIGALLGAFLGIGLAFLYEALDRRVRSEEDIETVLGVPLLGRIPRPARRLRQNNELVMLAEPQSIHAQTYRRLRTSLEFVNFERGARMIMLTSALPREGKSTTVANLALALARAGRKVALVDLDLRRPILHSFFNAGSDHGFTDVVVNRVKLHHALRSVALPGVGQLPSVSANGRPSSLGARNGQTDVECTLDVLPAGTIPPAADEFLESAGIGEVLEGLRQRFDFVLVDTPPLLAVGDVITLSTRMDAIVVVTRLGIHRRQLEELARQLHTCRAPVLGFILTGAAHGDSYSYGYGYDTRGYEVPREAETTVEPT